MTHEDWRNRSRKAIWHPYTEVTSFEHVDFPVIERAEGCLLYDVDGKSYLDGISSWWCVNLGHGHPRLVSAITEQAAKLQHSMLGGMSHPRAIELAERLREVVPSGLGHVMFGADGSLAVEAALKIALQYWTNQGVTGRTRFVALEDGYHGDTLGAIGVGYIDMFHKPYRPAVQPALCAISPHCAKCPFGQHPDNCETRCFQSMADLVAEHHESCAAVIVEPLCQGAAGIRVYPAAYLKKLRALCDRYGLLLIADEIAVGFGRTGKMFACDHADICPDILTIGKGLTGGMLPLSATLVTDQVFNTFRADGDRKRTFYHGTTYCGNPITCAVALAALDVYRDGQIIEGLPESARILADGMTQIAAVLESPMFAVGMIAAIELTESAGGSARAQAISRHARENGLFARPLGDTIYLWPPLNAGGSNLERMLSILLDAAKVTAKL